MSVFIKSAYANDGNTVEVTFPDDLDQDNKPDYIDEKECVVSGGRWDGERCFCPKGSVMTSDGCVTECGDNPDNPCPKDTMCYRDSDCRGCLEICENGRCVINEKDPCNGKEFCDGNKRVSCVKHGAKPYCQTHREEDDCTTYGSDYICSEENGGTKCVQDSKCDIGETVCFLDSVYQCNSSSKWEPFELCTGACGYCVDGACSGCGEDMICDNGSCVPVEIIYTCPVDLEEDDDSDSSGGGSGGSSGGTSGGSGSSSGGSGGGSSGGSGSSSGPTKTVYLSPDDPRCKRKCNEADCECGCNEDGIGCKQPVMVYTGECCTEGPVACCPDKEDCSPCQKAETCSDCPEGKEEGEKWCSSSTTLSLCSNGSVTYENCPENTGCRDGECKDLCAESSSECECGCDPTTGNCIEPIQKVTGSCCDQITSETCCPDDEACKCEPTEDCQCTCDPPCQPGFMCYMELSPSDEPLSCSCVQAERCVAKEGTLDVCYAEKCEECLSGICQTICGPDQECENGKCVDCDGCCLAFGCPSTCEPTPETCDDCKKCCEDLGVLEENEYCDCVPGGYPCEAMEKCEPGEKKCTSKNSRVKICQEDGRWKTIEECDEDACMECKDGGCVSICKENEVCDGEGTCENLCEDVECLCGQCDPKTGKCSIPEEECCEDPDFADNNPKICCDDPDYFGKNEHICCSDDYIEGHVTKCSCPEGGVRAVATSPKTCCLNGKAWDGSGYNEEDPDCACPQGEEHCRCEIASYAEEHPEECKGIGDECTERGQCAGPNTYCNFDDDIKKGKCQRLFDTAMNWYSADSYCKAQGTTGLGHGTSWCYFEEAVWEEANEKAIAAGKNPPKKCFDAPYGGPNANYWLAGKSGNVCANAVGTNIDPDYGGKVEGTTCTTVKWHPFCNNK